MRKVEQIEQQIEALSLHEFEELRHWILDRDWVSWDGQIEQDSQRGKLDKLIGGPRQDYEARRTREL